MLLQRIHIGLNFLTARLDEIFCIMRDCTRFHDTNRTRLKIASAQHALRQKPILRLSFEKRSVGVSGFNVARKLSAIRGKLGHNLLV